MKKEKNRVPEQTTAKHSSGKLSRNLNQAYLAKRP